MKRQKPNPAALLIPVFGLAVCAIMLSRYSDKPKRPVIVPVPAAPSDRTPTKEPTPLPSPPPWQPSAEQSSLAASVENARGDAIPISEKLCEVADAAARYVEMHANHELRMDDLLKMRLLHGYTNPVYSLVSVRDVSDAERVEWWRDNSECRAVLLAEASEAGYGVSGKYRVVLLRAR